MDRMEMITHNAQLVITLMGPASAVEPFGFNAASVRYIEGYIDRNREGMDAETTNKLISIFASFLGACVIACYGVAWIEQEDAFGVRVNQRLTFFPFAKVAKQFAHGADAGDGIAGAFDMIGVLKDADLSLDEHLS